MAAVGLIDKYSRSFIASAMGKGHDLGTICQTAGVSADIFLSESQLYGPEDLSAISRYVKRLMDDEFCGLTRRNCKAGTLAFACELILPCQNLEEALSKAFRFYGLVSEDIQFDLISNGELSDIRVYLLEPELDRANYLSEWFLLLWRNLAGWLIGEEIPVLKTHFSHAQQGAYEEYNQVFASECSFKQAENSITFHSKYLRKKIIRDMDDLETFYATSEIDLIHFSGVDYSLKSRIRSLLKGYFFDVLQFYPMESVAKKFNMSAQSLRRRLEDEGTSYRSIKEEIRREAAIQWLRDENISISEVSRMCGFAETNGLSRAMKSWVGMTPSDYREQILSGITHSKG